MATKAEKYAEVCKRTLDVSEVFLDQRWRAKISPEGGLWIYCDGISKGKLSAEGAVVLGKFIQENFLDEG